MWRELERAMQAVRAEFGRVVEELSDDANKKRGAARRSQIADILDRVDADIGDICSQRESDGKPAECAFQFSGC